VRRFGLVLLGGLAAVGCGGGGDGGNGPPIITSVVVSGDSTVILAGTRQLTANAFAGGTPVSTGVTFQWNSSDTSHILVTPSGEVWGYRLGSSNITARAVVNGTPTTVSSPPHAMRTRIGSIMFIPGNRQFESLGDSKTLEALALDAQNGVVPVIPFSWTSRAPSVVSVTPRANTALADVVALANGTARIVVTADGVSDSVTVTVQQVATTLVVTPDADTLHSIGAMFTPSVTADDANGNPVAVSALGWSSQNTAVATVSTVTGVVTAVNEGESRVIASSGSLADTIGVRVDQIPATIRISPANFGTPDVIMKTNQTAPFYAVVEDSLGNPALQDTVIWSTDDAAVANVAGTSSLDSTVISTFAVTGSATITATAASVSASRVVNVSSTPISFATSVQTVFSANCTGCHTGAGAAGGLSLASGVAHSSIVDQNSGQVPTLKRVRPSRPDSSYLVHKIQGTQATVGGSGSRMPLAAAPLSNATINIIRNWILQGALNN